MTVAVVNYVVTVQDWNGKRETECETEAQAWKAIGNRTIGGLYTVRSPTGLSCYDFIPY